jgi:polysaccharide export outer membrane protein
LLGAAAAACLSAGCDGAADLPRLPDAAEGEYRLGPGDQVRLITFGEDQLTGEFRVDAGGAVALPLVGDLHAGGLTPRGLAQATEAALVRLQLMPSPSVSVEVIAYRPFFVLGEVTRPGQYAYQPGMTVVAAVAVAGGFTYRAVSDRFSIVRLADGAAGAEGLAERQTRVQPGDVITVFERRL